MKYFKNLKSEINQSTDKGIRGNATNETINTLPIRLSYILKLNELLGIPNSASFRFVIPREKIESTNEYLQNEYKSIIAAFQFGSKVTKLWDTSHSIDIIKQIYKSWFRCDFITEKDSNRRVTSLVLNQLRKNTMPFVPINEIIVLPTPTVMEIEETEYIIKYKSQIHNVNMNEKEEEEKKEQQRIEYDILMEKRGNDAFRIMEQEKKNKKFKHEHRNQCLITNFLE